MNWLELFLIALGLSADAFAVAVSIGLTMTYFKISKALTVGMYFGLFQAFMPVIGYFLAKNFSGQVYAYGDLIAFGVLVFIGGKMIWESCRKSNEDTVVPEEASVSFAIMIPLAVATSIDAMAVGVSFAFLYVNIVSAVIFIGVTTFVLSVAGMKVGGMFGSKYGAKANLIGGIILVLIGVHVLIA